MHQHTMLKNVDLLSKNFKDKTVELTRPLPVLWPYIYKGICKIWPNLTWRIPLRNPHRFKDFVGIHSNRH